MLKFLEEMDLHSLVPYQKDTGKAIPFKGSPRKHPYNDERILLINDPFSTHTTIFYEFKLRDIVKVDEMPSIATEDGENFPMARVWVRQGAFGLRYEPFEVTDPLRFLRDQDIF